jgi:hypothetical protein
MKKMQVAGATITDTHEFFTQVKEMVPTEQLPSFLKSAEADVREQCQAEIDCVKEFITRFLDVAEEICPQLKGDEIWQSQGEHKEAWQKLLAVRESHKAVRATRAENQQKKVARLWGDAGLSIGLHHNTETLSVAKYIGY